MDLVTQLVDTETALERARIWRRLLVVRFGALAVIVAVVGSLVQGLSAYLRWAPVALFVLPPAGAWWHELRLTHRLSRLLKEGGLTRS